MKSIHSPRRPSAALRGPAKPNLSILIFAALTATAAADPYSIGVRVGGYGFKRDGDSSTTNSWSECRMNGLGVFANHVVRGPFFLEAGLDTYFSTNQPQPMDLPIDRQSALLSAAAGLRSSFTPWLAGYIQLGVGAELARLSVPYGGATIRDDKVMPDGFLGVGADVRVATGTYLGASFRVLVMGNFDYDPVRLQTQSPWVSTPASIDVFNASASFAAQAQFYLRRDL